MIKIKRKIKYQNLDFNKIYQSKIHCFSMSFMLKWKYKRERRFKDGSSS